MNQKEFIMMMKLSMSRAQFLTWAYNLVLSEFRDLKLVGVNILLEENPKAFRRLYHEHIKRNIPFHGR